MSIAPKLGLFFGGFLLVTLGLLIAGIGLLGLIDPAGTKLSDDVDPFGPTTRADYIWSVVLVIIGLVKILGGGYLLWRVDSKR